MERLVDLLSTAPARRFGLAAKGAIEVGRDADLVLFDPSLERTITATDLHHTSDYTPFEGLAVRGGVRTVFVRGSAVVRDGGFDSDLFFEALDLPPRAAFDGPSSRVRVTPDTGSVPGTGSV